MEKNKITAINTYATSVLTFRFGVVNWTPTDIENLQTKTRTLLTRYRFHHPHAAKERLTVPRQIGGRGLADTCNSAAWQTGEAPSDILLNTLRTGDADLRFYITTVQDGWRKFAFLTRACFPCTVHLIMQYIEPISEWFCWRMFIETWPHSELNFRHRASSI